MGRADLAVEGQGEGHGCLDLLYYTSGKVKETSMLLPVCTKKWTSTLNYGLAQTTWHHEGQCQCEPGLVQVEKVKAGATMHSVLSPPEC